MRSTATSYDVIVIGLGPAGARAAAAASRRGCRVLAIDRKARAGEPVQCAELVPALIGQDGARFAAQLTQSVLRMTTTVEGEAADETVPFPGHMIDRAAFDRAQVEAARIAGAHCCLALSAKNIHPRGVQLGDGRVVSAKVIIGADGPHSLVGRAVGRRNAVLVYARQLSVPLTAPSDATAIFLSRNIAGGYGWMFPKGAVAHLGIGVNVDARAQLKPLLAALHLRLLGAGRVGAEILARTGGAIPVGGRVRPFVEGDNQLTLLAGDAAGLTNPVTGAGIHAALVSGDLAGNAAADWLAGKRDAGLDYDEELEDIFGASIARAKTRRQHLLQRAAAHQTGPEDLRRAWIAYPQYWAAAPDQQDHIRRLQQ
jgi:digeranylgeranylglycerophospholipid reductase